MSKTKSPLKSIRAFCLDCCGGSANEVRLCVSKNCVLYPFRFGKLPDPAGKPLVKVIRAYCLGCLGGIASEVKQCTGTNCPLHPYRFGKNPNLIREISPEKKEAFNKGRFSFSTTAPRPRLNP